MIKVLYLRSSFDYGGTETLLLNLFNTLQPEIQFHYVFLKAGRLIPNLNSNTNKFYRAFRKSKLDLGVLLKISRILKCEKINTIHSHQMFELYYACLLKIGHPRLRIIHTIHGYNHYQNKWAPLVEKFLIRFTEHTFTVSKTARNILSENGYPASKINILYNAVCLPPKATDNEITAFKKLINYKTSDFIAGMIGNFVWWKDQRTIIDAFNILKNDLSELKIILIGNESSLSSECKKLLDEEDIGKRVFFLGPLENAAKYMPLFDIFIMSTLMDTFGIVVIEALMQKVPVLASDVAVMRELSYNGKYFELFKSKDPMILAEKIKKLYGKINQSLILNAYKYANEKYAYSHYIESLLKIYCTEDYEYIGIN